MLHEAGKHNHPNVCAMQSVAARLRPQPPSAGTNRRLYILIALSLMAHAALIFQAGFVKTRRTVSIELTLEQIPTPPARVAAAPPPPLPRPVAPRITEPPKPTPPEPQIAPVATPLPEPPETIKVPEAPPVRHAPPAAPVAENPPPPEPAEVAPAPSLAPDPGVVSRYLNAVRTRIEGQKKYPLVARRRGREGKVGLRFFLLADGRIEKLAVTTGSGVDSLDRAAVEAVRRATPFTGAPEGLIKEPIPLELTIVFKLD